MASIEETEHLNQELRRAGFLKFERNDALLDETLSNPLSSKNMVEGHWFYETVYMPRKQMYDNFVAEAKRLGWTYNQFVREYTAFIHKLYNDNHWYSFWEMFRDMETRASMRGWDVTPRPAGTHKEYVKSPDGFYMARLDKNRIREQRRRRWGR